jgi:peptidoglycan/LPS O-acetylase OafA/YrhL
MNVPALSRFRSDIEGLRAVAVLLVLFFHAGLPPHGGYIGVDIFFVISGFLITGLLLREAESSGRISLSNFYARRAKRLLPAATLVLLTSTVLIQFRAPESQRAIFNLDVVGAAAYFVNWRFAARSVDYLAEDLGRSPILHFWSLAVEEQFYFIWPLLIIASLYLAKKFGARRSVATTSALCLVLVPSLAWSVWYTKVSPAEAFFVTSTRLWELSAGALLALYQARIKQLPHALSSILGWGGVLLISVAAVMFNEKTVWPSYRAGLPTLGTALVIASGTISKEGRLYRLLSLRPMVWIGAISYSLYLWHWPLVVLGQDWLELKGRMWGGALVVASFVPALLSYHFVEQPTRRAPILDKLPAFALSLGFNLSQVSRRKVLLRPAGKLRRSNSPLSGVNCGQTHQASALGHWEASRRIHQLVCPRRSTTR